MRSLVLLGSALAIVLPSLDCGGGSGSSATGRDGGVEGGSGGGSGSGSSGGVGGSGSGSGSSSGSGSGGGGSGSSSGSGSGGGSGGDGGKGQLAAGWLYTMGNHIYVADGKGGGSVWTGRGVNMDDIFLCGYDNELQDTSPGATLTTIATGLVAAWKPSFVRISLGMDSFPTVVSWTTDPSQYATPMTGVIEALGAKGVYVLVTLRSDASMIEEVAGNDATFLPTDSTNTPDPSKYPSGTDATYVALVDTFASSDFVLFGLSNEPGGSSLSDATIEAAMSHAVGVIRGEEDRLKVPHHLVSVQGNGYTSDVSFYVKTPIAYDDVVYELHYYPGLAGETPTNYSYSSALPMIVGEYGDFTTAVPQSGFYADMEAKHIPSLAWDFEPFSDCSPDLLEVTDSDTTLTPTPWGSTVKAYLTSH